MRKTDFHLFEECIELNTERASKDTYFKYTSRATIFCIFFVIYADFCFGSFRLCYKHFFFSDDKLQFRTILWQDRTEKEQRRFQLIKITTGIFIPI